MPATLGGSVLRYVSSREAAGEFAATTTRGVRWVLWRFAESVGVERSPRTLTKRSIAKWIADRSTVAPATLRYELSVIRPYLQWLVAEGVLKKDPSFQIRGPKKPREVPRALAAADVARLLHYCPDTRARLIVSLMVQEGLRCLEVASLQLSDVDLVDETILVVGKGGHERLLPLSDETRTLISRYLHEQRVSAGPLVRSQLDPSKGIAAARVSILVGEWMRDAQVRGSAHALRHTAASDMLDHGANVRAVQLALGHASMGTTQRYLRRSEGKGLREAMGGRRYAQAIPPGVTAVKPGRTVPDVTGTPVSVHN